MPNAEIEILKKDNLGDEEKIICYHLFNKECPKRLAYQTLDEFYTHLDSLENAKHYLLLDNNIKGWAFTFLRDGETWFAMLLDETIHGKGKGSVLLNELKKEISALNGWVIDHNNDQLADGRQYQSPINFYLKNDFTVIHEMRIENEKISGVKISWKSKIGNKV